MHLYLYFNEKNFKPCKMFIYVCMYICIHIYTRMYEKKPDKVTFD